MPGTHCSPRQGKRSCPKKVEWCGDEHSNLRVFNGQSLKKELDSLLEEKILNPAPVDWQNSQSKDCAVISAIIDLITTQEKPAGGSKDYDTAPPPRGQHFYFDEDEDD